MPLRVIQHDFLLSMEYLAAWRHSHSFVTNLFIHRTLLFLNVSPYQSSLLNNCSYVIFFAQTSYVCFGDKYSLSGRLVAKSCYLLNDPIAIHSDKVSRISRTNLHLRLFSSNQYLLKGNNQQKPLAQIEQNKVPTIEQ